MKKLLLLASLLIFTSAAFSQQAAHGTSRIYSYGDYTVLEITGAPAEVLYRSLSVPSDSLTNGNITSNQKVGSNISCIETFTLRKTYFKCELSVGINSGAIGEGLLDNSK